MIVRSEYLPDSKQLRSLAFAATEWKGTIVTNRLIALFTRESAMVPVKKF